MIGRMLVLIFLPILGAQGEEPMQSPSDSYERLLKEKAPALVTVKYVLKVEDEESVDESEEELTGVMIDPSGIVMCSSASLAAPKLLEAYGVRASAARIKVLIGEKDEELDAKIVARDQELDLAWLRIKAAAGRKFDAIDLSKSVKARPGDRLLTITRLDKYFERAAVVHEGPLAGVLRKPRDLYAVSSGMDGETGLPVFNLEGSLVGVFVLQMPDREDSEGDPDGLLDAVDVFILPADAVEKATKRAMQAEKDE